VNLTIRYTLVIVLISTLVSCSKSDADLTTQGTPKLLKEVKIIETIGGDPVDSSITAFEYNEKAQIVKRINRMEVDTYEAYEYKDNLPVSLKSYYKGSLVQSVSNPVTVKGNKIIYTFVYLPAPSSPDSVLLQFSFDGTKMTEYRTSLLYPENSKDEYIQLYSYSSNKLTGITNISSHDGQELNPYTIAVDKSDNKTNPFSNQSAMNKTLMSIGQDMYAQGLNNILEWEATSISSDVTKYEYTYDADGYVTTMKKAGAKIATRFYTYTR
jgi:hypothetical protein